MEHKYQLVQVQYEILWLCTEGWSLYTKLVAISWCGLTLTLCFPSFIARFEM